MTPPPPPPHATRPAVWHCSADAIEKDSRFFSGFQKTRRFREIMQANLFLCVPLMIQGDSPFTRPFSVLTPQPRTMQKVLHSQRSFARLSAESIASTALPGPAPAQHGLARRSSRAKDIRRHRCGNCGGSLRQPAGHRERRGPQPRTAGPSRLPLAAEGTRLVTERHTLPC